MTTRTQPAISHSTAVMAIASVAFIWGVGFPTMRIVLDSGLSVGAFISLRFTLAGVAMLVIIRIRRIAIVRRALLDGLWLGLLLSVIFWLQTDGLRFTTVAKSGFITGLYVLFTPLVAVLVGQQVKLASAVGAAIATCGLYLLVHLPGGFWSGWNRGDVETLLCAILCGFHIVMTGHYARRSDAWVLAGTQVLVTGLLTLAVAAFLPAPYGLQHIATVFIQPRVGIAMLYMALLSTVFAFWAQTVAQTRLGPTESAVLFCIEPVTAAVLSVVWLREPMTPRQATGGALIVLAMIVAEALPYMFRAITVPDTRP